MSIIKKMVDRKLITPPKWLVGSIQYETLAGSKAYGTETESSDTDVCAWCLPPEELMLARCEIPGFGKKAKKFDSLCGKVTDPATLAEYDYKVYSLVHFCQLGMENNPHILEALFSPDSILLTCTHIGHFIRDNASLFPCKELYHRFAGYSQSQYKLAVTMPARTNGVWASWEKHGYVTKWAAHAIRVLQYGTELLTDGSLDMANHTEQLQSIRRGELSVEEFQQLWYDGDAALREAYRKSTLPAEQREPEIRDLLVQIIRSHYGRAAC